MKNKIDVLLVENQTLTRVGIKTILSAQDDIEIVGGRDGVFAVRFELNGMRTIASKGENTIVRECVLRLLITFRQSKNTLPNGRVSAFGR